MSDTIKTNFIVIKNKHSDDIEMPFCLLSNNGDICRLTGKSCRFGLTEVVVPSWCPMKDGSIIKISIGTKIIETDF